MAKTPTYNWTVEDAALEGRVDTLIKTGETNNAFALRCGLNPGNFLKFKQHKISLGATYCRRISTVCQVSYHWLKEGIGERDDQEGMVSEPLPDRNRVYATMQKKNDEDISQSDAFAMEILKAENNALRTALQNISSTMDILKQTLEQNQQVLAQNGEALSQNRALMKLISTWVEHK